MRQKRKSGRERQRSEEARHNLVWAVAGGRPLVDVVVDVPRGMTGGVGGCWGKGVGKPQQVVKSTTVLLTQVDDQGFPSPPPQHNFVLWTRRQFRALEAAATPRLPHDAFVRQDLAASG